MRNVCIFIAFRIYSQCRLQQHQTFYHTQQLEKPINQKAFKQFSTKEHHTEHNTKITGPI